MPDRFDKRAAGWLVGALSEWRASRRTTILVSEAVDIVAKAMPLGPEHGMADVYVHDEGFGVIHLRDGRDEVISRAGDNFDAFCRETSIVPRDPRAPMVKDYRNYKVHGHYVITGDEFERYARGCGLDATKLGSTHGGAASPPRGDDRQAPPGTTAIGGVVVHQLKNRRDELDPAIDLAVGLAGGLDPAAVWNAFVVLAELRDPPHPLISVRDGEVTYRTAKGSEGINRAAFAKRIKRRSARELPVPLSAAKRR